MWRKLPVAALILLSSGVVGAQFSVRSGAPSAPSTALTMDDLLTAAKHYFRDTAELPMVQTTTLIITDSSGRRRKPQSISTEYVFHGYSRQNQTANSHISGHESMWAVLRGSKMIKTSLNGALWTMMPGLRLYAERNDYELHVFGSQRADQPITAELTPVKPCAAFTMKKLAGYYIPDQPCGPSQFQLGNDLVFQRFSFEAGGVPAPVKMDPFGHCTLRRYHADVSFQSVNLPGDTEPSLVPKQVTATLEADKGTIVISSSYQPKTVTTKLR